MEVGVMFWAAPDAVATVQGVKALGVNCGQLGVTGDFPLTGAAPAWKAALEAESFCLVTVFAAYNGEDYADIPTVERTVGFIPVATREEREARTLELSDFAAALGVTSIACHIGFVPHDKNHPDYVAVRDMVRRVCDHAAKNGQTFALETGQEPAHTLLDFFQDVDRANLGINFDPANLILYGTDEPLPALGVLGKHVISVHAKDGINPAAPGALGSEKPLGQGSVNIPAFVAKLKEIGYSGAVNIEREGQSPEQWRADVSMAVGLLNSLI
ncbi:MAG: sugar phosphate isomerase/epimerase [Acidobacteria bacterium]|nr:sugar phosphate isomerase/epimerase [Acidobacteriota bacterium]